MTALTHLAVCLVSVFVFCVPAKRLRLVHLISRLRLIFTSPKCVTAVCFYAHGHEHYNYDYAESCDHDVDDYTLLLVLTHTLSIAGDGEDADDVWC